MDAISLDELSRLGEPDRRNRLVVFDDELDAASAGLVTHLVEREEEAVENVAAVLHVRSGERSQESDFNRIFLMWLRRALTTGCERSAPDRHDGETRRQDTRTHPTHSLPRRATSA